MKTFVWFCLLATLPSTAIVRASVTAADSQIIAIESNLQIPGGVLLPGRYTFSVEDRMSGRAIVRIENAATAAHQLLLTVPNSKILAGKREQIVLFSSADQGKKTLRAWMCPNCDKALEMVYPKAEAAQITAETGQSIMAADPAYDRLPANLSPDDMKVVTLWLLSPERIEGHRGIGLKAEQYALPAVGRATETSGASVSGSLPETASSTYESGLVGLLLLAIYSVLRFRDSRRKRCLA